MSKIAEKKVMELGYGIDPLGRNEYSANDVFDAAVECYDQAFQDFMEKACEWLKSYRQETSDKTGYIAGIVNDETIKQFKNYMQNEM